MGELSGAFRVLRAAIVMIVAASIGTAAQAQGELNYYKISGKSTIMVHDDGSTCTMTIRANDRARMARFVVGGDAPAMIAFSSKQQLVAKDQNELHVRVFESRDWQDPIPLRFGIAEKQGDFYTNISLNPAVKDVVGKLRNSTMIQWSRPSSVYGTEALSYEQIDILAASLVLDSCQSDRKAKKKDESDDSLNFDWLVPRSGN